MSGGDASRIELLPRSRGWVVTPVILLNVLVLLLALSTGSLAMVTSLTATEWLLFELHIALVWTSASLLMATFVLGLGISKRTRAALNSGRNSPFTGIYFGTVTITLVLHVVLVVLLVGFNRTVRNSQESLQDHVRAYWSAHKRIDDLQSLLKCSGLEGGENPCFPLLLGVAREQGRTFVKVLSLTVWILVSMFVLVLQLVLPAKHYSEKLGGPSDDISDTMMAQGDVPMGARRRRS